MSIEFNCDHCGKLLRTSDDKAGLSAKCPECSAPITVPGIPVSNDSDSEFNHFSDEPEAPRRSIKCPMCGAEVSAGDKTCRACGESLNVNWSGDQYNPLQPHRGVLLLTLSIVSWFFFCFLFSIPVWIIAANDLNQMSLGNMDPEGEGMTKAARIISIIHVVISLLLFLGFCVVFPLLGIAFAP